MTRVSNVLFLSWLAVLLGVACARGGDAPGRPDAPPTPADARPVFDSPPQPDARVQPDARPQPDAPRPPDARPPDAGGQPCLVNENCPNGTCCWFFKCVPGTRIGDPPDGGGDPPGCWPDQL